MTNPSERPPVVGVLLAAGSGSRLGRGPKALLRKPDGRSLLESALAALLGGGCTRVVVVLGAEAERVAAELKDKGRTTVLVNEHWASGMGSSLALGLETVPDGASALVALVDQPGLNAKLVRRILAEHRPARITAAAYGPDIAHLRRGHPVLFAPEHVAPAAAAATGDNGARAYLAGHRELVDLVDCSDLDTGQDIDTVADLHLLERH
ncbi:nucleotidyltransferase family protein [Paeniglutamicibacter sp. ABSL32-1]|uniref:nucleotidyltransferase family protein n=1 Tax=Paeniglutamicibacter quisquiliarum TaxID=2849498 RepID=UPI001C2DA5D4|nr:nucleotidyltransferase family protein [Paeniglutamicibacter quisquiliarum]MBV1777964.1 nucleotidyltransferase family protein [Paeniglutamicibacter quisquiliarum]